MRLGLLIVIILIVIAACCVFRHKILEAFTSTDSIQVSWTPSGPNPANIAYNWGVCISQGNNQSQSACANQNPAFPPGPPGTGWRNKGQTPQGQASLALNSRTCLDCSFGQVLTLMIQAIDVVNPLHPTSAWATFTIDLSSKATAIKNTITDSTAPSQPIYPGSSGFIYTLQLNEPGFASGNNASLAAQLVRGGQSFSLPSVPFTSISPDGTTGVYNGSFTSSSASPWNQMPGALQAGDILWIYPLVVGPGSGQNDGEVYFTGAISQTATTVTPTTPTSLVWNINL